jgi:hypothetical protein
MGTGGLDGATSVFEHEVKKAPKHVNSNTIVKFFIPIGAVLICVYGTSISKVSFSYPHLTEIQRIKKPQDNGYLRFSHKV